MEEKRILQAVKFFENEIKLLKRDPKGYEKTIEIYKLAKSCLANKSISVTEEAILEAINYFDNEIKELKESQNKCKYKDDKKWYGEIIEVFETAKNRLGNMLITKN